MNQDKKIVFVILHYLTIEDTKQAVSSIEQCMDTEDYQIVIVDNASFNDSGNLLKLFYKENHKVDVIINKENLGFANGNNVGISYAKDQYDPNFIVVMNNDILLLETKLYCKLCEAYEKERFGVLGPLVITRDGKCTSNPPRVKFTNKQDVKQFLKLHEFRRKLMKVHLYQFYRVYSRVKEDLQKKKFADRSFFKPADNVKLHGCFLVFSRAFLDKNTGFDTRTFLYLEEDILYHKMIKQKVKMIYRPDIVVYHKEDSATNACNNSNSQKRLMITNEYIRSGMTLLQVMDECERDF